MQKPEDHEKRKHLISLKKAAAMIECSVRTVRREIQRGKLPPIIKVRSLSRLSLRAVESYIENLTATSH